MPRIVRCWTHQARGASLPPTARSLAAASGTGRSSSGSTPKEWAWILNTVASAWIFLGVTATSFVGCLALAVVFLIAAAARWRWVVRPGEITSFVGVWGGLGWSRTTEIEWLDRIEMRKVPGDASSPWRFEIALVDLDEEDKVVFGQMTEGEARWMAGIVADILKDALPRSGQEVYRWSVTVDPPAAGSRAMADFLLDEVLADPGPKGSAAAKRE